MKPYYQDHHIRIFNKDCRSMEEITDNSIQCVVTSPPYWGLRKYSGEQELIWGDTNCEHQWVDAVKPDDAGQGHYTGRTRWQHIAKEAQEKGVPVREIDPTAWAKGGFITGFCSLCGAWKGSYGLEPTPEMYIQHTIEILREIRRVLRKDGVVFWNIGDSYASKAGGYSNNGSRGSTSVISAKTQAAVVKGKRIARGSGRWGGGNMPASGHLKEKDLCLIPFRIAIAAQEDGWWVRSVIIWSKPNPMPESVTDRPTESHEYILMLTKSARYYWDADAVRGIPIPSSIERGLRGYRMSGFKSKGMVEEYDQIGGIRDWSAGRNIRSVWEFPTQPYPEAHFAVFPEKLPEICIKAASKEGDLVLDPFAGAGTTLWVAKKLGRKAIGYEISEEYCNLALNRNRQQVFI